MTPGRRRLKAVVAGAAPSRGHRPASVPAREVGLAPLGRRAGALRARVGRRGRRPGRGVQAAIGVLRVVRVGRHRGARAGARRHRGGWGPQHPRREARRHRFDDGRLRRRLSHPDAPLSADAITVSPYLGFGSLTPAFERAIANDRGVYVLARTSNPEGGEIQLALGKEGSVVQEIIDAATQANAGAQTRAIGLVIGGTHHTLGCDVSQSNGSILVPGIGFQGGRMELLPELFGEATNQVLPVVGRGALGWTQPRGLADKGARFPREMTWSDAGFTARLCPTRCPLPLGDNVSIPQLTTERLQAARAAATQARRQRADLKAKVRSGALSLSEAIDVAGEDDVLAHVKVVDLLKSLPRVGEKRAAAVMERLDIAPNRRIRGLGRHQIAGLKAEFK